MALHPVLAEFASDIGGEALVVECLIPSGSDPHGFSPAPSDVKAIARADLILASGFGMEPWLEKLIASSGTKASLFDASTAIRHPVLSSEEERQGAHSHEHGEVDPHWWHSVAAAREVCVALALRMQSLRPGLQAVFAERQRRHDARLSALQTWVLDELASLPEGRRQLVTSHDAFGYLARDYHFQVHPLCGINPEEEPDAKGLAGLIVLIRNAHIRCVFADNTENPKLLASMLRESGAVLGGTLYADGPGPKGSAVETYEAMVRHNVRTLVQGLRGN